MVLGATMATYALAVFGGRGGLLHHLLGCGLVHVAQLALCSILERLSALSTLHVSIFITSFTALPALMSLVRGLLEALEKII